MKRLSGKNMTLELEPSGIAVEFEEVTLSIEDGTAEAMDGGRPNGFIEGEVKAGGDLTVDLENFELLNIAAKQAGSFSQLPVQDFLFFGKTEELTEKVEAFGCKLTISDAVSLKTAGGEKLLRKIPFRVTGRDFVHINGVPYLPQPE